jgi:hypothetical protein
MTREEMKDYVKVILKLLEKEPVPEGGWHFTWDNAHNNATDDDLADLGLSPGQRLPLPPYGPDLHKVIEHIIHFLKSAFKADATNAGEALTPEEYQAMLLEAFESITPAQVQADANTLPITYLAVARPKGSKTWVTINGKEWVVEGSGGDWPRRSYR